MQQLSASQTSPEVPINENFAAMYAAAIFSKRHPATTGLTWGFHGGLYNGNTIADGTVTLTNAADNYVVVLRSTGVVSTSTSATNSLNPLYAKLYKLTCAGSVVTVEVDQRWDTNGLMSVQPRGIPQNSQTGNYTAVAADAGAHLFHPSGAGAGDTFTIPSNASVPYPIGTVLTFFNMATDNLSIAITTDTMNLAGAGTTGTRTLAQYGVATAVKLTSTVWLISGTGLT